MIDVENAEGESSPRFFEGCRAPAHPQKLVIPFNPFGIFCACTELHIDIVSFIDVDNENNINLQVLGWTDGMLMTDVECVTQIV